MNRRIGMPCQVTQDRFSDTKQLCIQTLVAAGHICFEKIAHVDVIQLAVGYYVNKVK